MTLSTDASLLRIPPAALLKLVTLSFSTADFFLGNFGHLVWKDPVIVPIGKTRNSATLADMMVMTATKDRWAWKTILTSSVMNAVNGLCTSIDHLQNPSILSADRVQGMFRTVLHIFSKNNGKEDTDHMADVFFVRVQQQVEEVRVLALDNNATLHVLKTGTDARR